MKSSSLITRKILKVLFLSIFLMGTISSCVPTSFFSKPVQTVQTLSQAEVVFQVTLPSAIPNNSTLVLEILDDVTGLSMNPQKYEMTKQDDRTYFIKIPLVIGSVVKYRYIRQAEVSTTEYTPQGGQVRYRLANISGPEIIRDNIAGWIDQLYAGPFGRVRGQFIDKNTNAPIPNLLVTAEGVQTVTASDGSFILEGLTPGTHSLVAYSMDGQFSTFSQGVTIAEESTTPVFVYLDKRPFVNVTFNITLPEGFNNQLPLRFASNDQALGNIYADLYSGSTTVAANLPILTKVSTDHYRLQLKLPAGYDLRYKYTFGDGLWNSELDTTGAFVLREVIVPSADTTIDDVVSTFQSPSFGAVSFFVTTSSEIPSDEIVSIQFNPFGWFESIPMAKIGPNQWEYTLYSPLNLFGEIEYRFCRNNLCELTQAVAQTDQNFTPTQQIQTISQNITQWTNYLISTTPTVVVTDGGDISPRPDFTAGFEITDNYSPLFSSYIVNGLNRISSTGSNFVVLSPTWTATRNSPPYLEPVPGSDISWNEMQTEIIWAGQDNLNVALFPRINFPEGASAYWESATRDDGWWTSWYDRYHRYMMQVADWATLTGVKTIIIGDPMVSPSMSNGVLANGNLSLAPEDADAQWRQLIQDLRSRFSGSILGAVAYPSNSVTPTWLDSVDGIYVLYSPALAQTSGASIGDLETIFQHDLEQSLYPMLSGFKKPIWLGLDYPSSTNSFAGCKDTLGSCLDDWGNHQLDLDTQSLIYNAAIIVAGKENWITGFISRDNQPIAEVLDGSPSVLSKPANDVLWFWYHFILNKTP
jgi:Carboxypeptidase regulatory-like domain